MRYEQKQMRSMFQAIQEGGASGGTYEGFIFTRCMSQSVGEHLIGKRCLKLEAALSALTFVFKDHCPRLNVPGYPELEDVIYASTSWKVQMLLELTVHHANSLAMLRRASIPIIIFVLLPGAYLLDVEDELARHIGLRHAKSRFPGSCFGLQDGRGRKRWITRPGKTRTLSSKPTSSPKYRSQITEPIWKICSQGEARILVGHGLDHYLECLGVDYPEFLIKDTAIYPPLMKTSKLSNSLKYLTQASLGPVRGLCGCDEDLYQDAITESSARLSLRLRRKPQQLPSVEATGAGEDDT
ncbi:hypothetical protein C4D60_Mb09t16750 [Musa balbisiana]|uniref:Exonuclease domain-containing protein n=1 Tax=Musa balbisiana TaxID=52838 RepID=A0A4S8IH17_MUSBA|nr:hypothetical protein C4D60_Mb09t16750 [Musa balbisiana]